ncbi:MAG: hypothetical protein ACKVS6_07570 [Planctomycetota bacterium]
MPSVAPREAIRRLTHASAGLLSLTLLWLPWHIVVICCVAGIAFNFFAMPVIAPHIFRPNESKFSGIRAYPMAVLLLVLLFPMRTAAAAWAVLAFGDAMAALIGRAYGTNKLPWNREKSLQGLLAFICFGTCAGALVYNFVEPREPAVYGWFSEIYNFLNVSWSSGKQTNSAGFGLADYRIWTISLAASFAAGIAETIYVKIDDNFRTAIAAGIVYLYLDPLTMASFV